MVQKFKWDLFKLFSKKLSEKQRVSVLILFLAVFLFVKGCRSVIFCLLKMVRGFSGERFFGVEVPDDSQHDLKQNIPNTLRYTNIGIGKCQTNSYSNSIHMVFLPWQSYCFGVRFRSMWHTVVDLHSTHDPNAFNNGRPSRMA